MCAEAENNVLLLHEQKILFHLKLLIMAKAKGFIKIEGSVEDLTFYRLDGENYVRAKGGVSRERIMNDPSYVRTRENMREFGESARTGKIVREAVSSMSFRAKDSRVSSRLSGVMAQVKNTDTTSSRGNRLVSNGIKTPKGKQALTGFDFNVHSSLGTALFSPYTLDVVTGVIGITDIVTADQIMFPQGATNVRFQSAVVAIDFTSGVSVIAYSNVVDLPISMLSSDVLLTPTSVPAGLDCQLFLFSLTFSQEFNGVMYPFKNEEFNVLQIIDVV